jgi:lipoprotein-releasing system ATP-binding protein
MSVLLQAENLHKTYAVRSAPVHVLRGASLSVAAGESVAIIGTSGAGKSTLLHVLGTLDNPEAGSVRIAGVDVYRSAQRVRSRLRSEALGFVFQSYHLLPEMNVAENVMLPAMARHGFLLNAPRWRARALELLQAVGLGERADHAPQELSGGEQQRVALARALMNAPQILLADEPTGNLDPATGQQVLRQLFALTLDSGRALVIVTHNEEAARCCNRVLRLLDGVLVGAQG